MRPPRLTNLLAEAPGHLPEFLERLEGVSHANKGIRRSEMFFLYANIAAAEPARILESGRARAQSTLVLSLLFPRAKIISIESDAASADVAVAQERLRERANVEALFGNSRQLLPQMTRQGDVVLIDGPKDFRALKLALSLLRTGKPVAVFVHDLWRGSPARSFVDCSLPEAFFSDALPWIEHFASLDRKSLPARKFLPNDCVAYGATLCCLPPEQVNYTRRLARCALAQIAERGRETLRKFRRHPARERPADFAVIEPVASRPQSA